MMSIVVGDPPKVLRRAVLRRRSRQHGIPSGVSHGCQRPIKCGPRDNFLGFKSEGIRPFRRSVSSSSRVLGELQQVAFHGQISLRLKPTVLGLCQKRVFAFTLLSRGPQRRILSRYHFQQHDARGTHKRYGHKPHVVQQAEASWDHGIMGSAVETRRCHALAQKAESLTVVP